MPRGRPRKIQSARREVGNVLKWAEQQGFYNIAAALRRIQKAVDRILAAEPERQGHRGRDSRRPRA